MTHLLSKVMNKVGGWRSAFSAVLFVNAFYDRTAGEIFHPPPFIGPANRNGA